MLIGECITDSEEPVAAKGLEGDCDQLMPVEESSPSETLFELFSKCRARDYQLVARVGGSNTLATNGLGSKSRLSLAKRRVGFGSRSVPECDALRNRAHRAAVS
jgi:hypothetical protein